MAMDEEDSVVVMLVRTDHGPGDPTSITQEWGDDVVVQADASHLPRADLYVKSKPMGRSAQSFPQKRTGRHDLLVFYGHGLDDALLMPGGPPECYCIFLGSHDVPMLQNKHVCATACCSASVLGPSAVQQGAVCYVGYSRPFYLYVDDAEFRRCANAWVEPLLKNRQDWGAALEAMKRSYRDRIDFCHTQAGIAKYALAWIPTGPSRPNKSGG